jgi:hypothetical protein
MNVSINLESYDLAAAERQLCLEALAAAGNIVDAAKLLGLTRHALKRRIVKHRIPWQRRASDLSPSDTRPASRSHAELLIYEDWRWADCQNSTRIARSSCTQRYGAAPTCSTTEL